MSGFAPDPARMIPTERRECFPVTDPVRDIVEVIKRDERLAERKRIVAIIEAMRDESKRAAMAADSSGFLVLPGRMVAVAEAMDELLAKIQEDNA